MANPSNEEARRFTRDCIYKSMYLLLETTPYDQITLRALAQKAGVSRNAIYRNFKSKDDILKTYVREFAASVSRVLEQAGDCSDETYITILFQQLCAFHKQAKILTDLGMYALLLETFMSIRGRFSDSEVHRDYFENYRIGAIFFVYLTWLKNDCRETPEQLCAIVRSIEQ